MAVAYLVDPNNQFMTKSGTINVGGHIHVYLAATDDAAVTYKDFNGTVNPQDIILDDNGRAVIIADNAVAYRIEVYDRYNMLQWTQTPVWCMAAGGGVSTVRVQSSDGTISVTKTTEGGTVVYDLSTQVEKEPAPYGTASFSTSGVYATGESFVALPWTQFGGDLTVQDQAFVIPYDAIADVDCDVVVTYDQSLPKSSIFVRVEVEYGSEDFALPTRELDMSQDCPSVHFSFKVPVHEGETLTYKLYYQCAESVSCGIDARSWLNLEVNNLSDDPNNNYELLINKPSINGVELVGDKSGSELHLQDKLTEGDYIHIDASNVISVSGLQPSGSYVYESSFNAYTASADSSFVYNSSFTAYTANNYTSITSIENNINTLSSDISGKLDATASAMFQPSGNYQTAGDYLSSTDSAKFLLTSQSGLFQPSGNYQTAGDYAFNSSLSSKLDVSAFTAYTATATLSGDYLENSAFNIYSASANSAFVHTSDMSAYQTKLNWEYDENNNISGVDGSAFAGIGGGGDYSGIEPIMVDNTARTISVDHTGLSVDETMTAYESGDDIVIGLNSDILAQYQLTANMSAYQLSGDYQTAGNYLSSTDSAEFLLTSQSGMFQPSGNYQPSGDYLSATESANYQLTADMSAYQLSGDYAYNSSLADKLDASASSDFQLTSNMSGYYTTANESGFITGFPLNITAGDVSASGRVRARNSDGDLYGNFDYAGMYFHSGSQRPYNIGIDATGSNFYIATAKSKYERIYASSIKSWNGKQDASAMTAYQPVGDYQPSGDYIYASALGILEI